MEEFYVLKNETTGQYFSNDRVFIEPNKKYAKKLRKGQAQSLQSTYNRLSRKSEIVIELAE